MARNGTERSGGWWAAVTLGMAGMYLVPLAVVAIVAASVGTGSGGGSGAPGASSTATVTLSEFAIKGDLSAPAGAITLNVDNGGSQVHNLVVEGGPKTADLATGKSESLDLSSLAPGTYEVFCSIPGHKDSGMDATFTVTEAGAGGSSGEAASGGMDHSGGSLAGTGTIDFAKMDEDMVKSFNPFIEQLTSGKPNTEGVGNPLLEPTSISADGTKNFELTAKIAKWEVEPGKLVDAWTYNGVVPAPMIRLNVGDKMTMKLKNELPVATDIHWHGLEVPFEQDGVAPITQDPIAPGATFTYAFSLDRPYQGMYHPHLHGQMALPNGMFGVIQVGETPVPRGRTIGGTPIPRDVQLAVDIPMVLNDAGVIGLSLNGKSFPATAPIELKEGEWGAITYYNEGLQLHPMHMHQFPVAVVARDGFPLDSPYWADTVSVAPGERVTVVFHATKKGVWAFHCHILNHAEREDGMFGMVTAVVVE